MVGYHGSRVNPWIDVRAVQVNSLAELGSRKSKILPNSAKLFQLDHIVKDHHANHLPNTWQTH